MEEFINNNWLLVVLAALWTIPWKGIALWKSARLGDKWWFIALLIVNAFGILEILYVYVWSKRESLKSTSPGREAY